MTKGFALVASPAPYGGSGSMSFIVNQERKRIQKDLRPRTAALASTITLFDPDLSWAKIDIMKQQ
jgi:hypothetical protein